MLKEGKGKQFDEDFRHVASFYGDDVNTFLLEAQLSLLAPTARATGFDIDSFNVHDLIKMFQQLEESRISAMSEVLLLGKIFMVMPATNAVREQSFLMPGTGAEEFLPGYQNVSRYLDGVSNLI